MEKTGTIQFDDGQYYLQVGRHRQALKAGPLQDPDVLKAMVGQEVEITYGEPAIIALSVTAGSAPIKKIKILCYVPRDDLLGLMAISPEIRVSLLKTLYQEGVITERVYEGQMKRG